MTKVYICEMDFHDTQEFMVADEEDAWKQCEIYLESIGIDPYEVEIFDEHEDND